MNIVNKYNYCGFAITTIYENGDYYCLTDPKIENTVTRFSSTQNTVENDIEEQIDKL